MFSFKPGRLKSGNEIAREVGRYIGSTKGILNTCREIVKNANLYACYLVEECNGDQRSRFPSESEWSKSLESGMEWLEKETAKLVSNLPTVDGEPIKLAMGGDCRGSTTILHMPDGKEIAVA